MLWLLYDSLPWKRWKGCKISNCSKVEKKKSAKKQHIMPSCCFCRGPKETHCDETKWWNNQIKSKHNKIKSNTFLMIEGGNQGTWKKHRNIGRVCQLHTERSSNPKLALWPWSWPWDSQSVCLTAWAIYRLLWYVDWWIFVSCSNSQGLLFYDILEWNSKSTQFQQVLEW